MATHAAHSISSKDLATRFRPDLNCQHQPLPTQLGRGASNIFTLEPDFHLIETDYTPNRNLAVSSRIEQQQPLAVVTLGLKGKSRFSSRDGNELTFEQGYTSITAFNAADGIRHYRGEQSVLQLRFSVGQNWLARHFEYSQVAKVFSGGHVNLISHRPTSAQALLAAQSLMQANMPGPAQSLFRHGLAQAILASELSPLFGNEAPQSGRFGQKEKTMARQARDILWAEFKNPPSVMALARRVGTNDCKLKQLFRHFFDTTPYGVVLDSRMHHAYQLLKTEGLSIGIVAETVGYQHASNFSAAFCRYFGHPPRQLAKHG